MLVAGSDIIKNLLNTQGMKTKIERTPKTSILRACTTYFHLDISPYLYTVILWVTITNKIKSTPFITLQGFYKHLITHLSININRTMKHPSITGGGRWTIPFNRISKIFLCSYNTCYQNNTIYSNPHRFIRGILTSINRQLSFWYFFFNP